MTFETVQKKVLNGWWLILLTPIALTLIFFPWVQEKSYLASTTVGIQVNPQNVANNPTSQVDSQLAYAQSLEQISLYISNRFNTIEIQHRIARTASITVGNFSEQKPFYTVTPMGGGFVTLSFSSQSEEEANNFVKVVQGQVYGDLVGEWNSVAPSNLQAKSMNNFLSTVTEVGKAKQLQVLPALAGLILGIILALLLPLQNSASSKNK